MTTQRTPERLFHGHPCFETSAEVYAVLHARHGHQLKVWSSCSDPTGTAFMGDGTHGRMETVWMLDGADQPLIGIKSTWEIGANDERLNKHTEYFLMIPKDKADE